MTSLALAWVLVTLFKRQDTKGDFPSFVFFLTGLLDFFTAVFVTAMITGNWK